MTQDEKPTTTPTVSIGMPVYNGEKYIREALDSLLAQTFTDFELIISDNASTDATQELCRHYAWQDSRVKYIRQPCNRGAAENFAFVLKQARGRFFMWAAHDDVRHPDFLTTTVAALRANPDAVLAFSDFQLVDGTGQVTATFDRWGRRFEMRKLWQLCWFLLAKPDGSRKCVLIYGLMRTERLRARGGMERLRDDYAGSDIVTLYDLLCLGNFRVTPRTLFSYRYGHRPPPIDVSALGRWSAIYARLHRHLGRYHLFLSRRYMNSRAFWRCTVHAPVHPLKRVALYACIIVSGIFLVARVTAVGVYGDMSSRRVAF